MKLLSIFVVLLLPLLCEAQTPISDIKQVKELPPIPVTRELVNDEVNEKKAYILTPEQIETLKSAASKARRANITPYPDSKIAKPVSRQFLIDPDVQQQPRLIRMTAGLISSIVFSDYAGNPWLIKSVSFDCGLFDDGSTCRSQSTGQKNPTNILKVQPITPYSYGNIVVELEELPVPINFLLAAGQAEETDITISTRVVGKNPNAKAQVVQIASMPSHDSVMGYFLDGVPPKGAQRLKVGGGLADAWSVNGQLYVRTRLSLLSPAFTDHAGSADGMHVYKFQRVYPQILASQNGIQTTLFLSGF